MQPFSEAQLLLLQLLSSEEQPQTVAPCFLTLCQTFGPCGPRPAVTALSFCPAQGDTSYPLNKLKEPSGPWGPGCEKQHYCKSCCLIQEFQLCRAWGDTPTLLHPCKLWFDNLIIKKMRQCLFSKEKQALALLFLTQTESPVPQLNIQNISILLLHSSHTHQTHLECIESVRSSHRLSHQWEQGDLVPYIQGRMAHSVL